MSLRSRIVLGVLWVVSLILVAELARAQSYQFIPNPNPFVLSGDEIGFRVEGSMGGAPAGALVIRVDGRWVEPRAAPKLPLRISPSR